MASQPVQAILRLFQTEPTLLGGPGEVLQLATALEFSKPGILSAREPYITLESLDYKEGAMPSSLDQWKQAFTHTEENEKGWLSGHLMKNTDSENRLHILEVFESERYYSNTHAKNSVIAALQEEQHAKRTAIESVQLRMVAGYLHKPRSTSPNL
jgi:quinol monooxygenase YgiN